MRKFHLLYNFGADNRFFVKSVPTLEEVMNDEDYVWVGEVEAFDVDRLFQACNIAHPAILLETVNGLAALDPTHIKWPSLHTSMSCNDIAVDVTDEENQIVYFCDSCGWKILK